MLLHILKRASLLSIIIILTLPSCAPAPEVFAADEVDEHIVSKYLFTEQYIYFSEPITKGDSQFLRIVRMNIETGQVNVPCVDPLCAHDNDDCPLCCGTTLGSFRIFGDWLYYWTTYNRYQGAMRSVRKYILYNLETGEYREIFEDLGDGSMAAGYVANIGDDIFHVTYSTATKDPETGEYLLSSVIKSYNLSTGKEKEIYRSPDELLKLKTASNNRLYFGTFTYDDVDQTFSIDKNGKNLRKEPNFKLYNPYNIYSDIAYGHDENNRIWANDLKTGELRLIVDDFCAYSLVTKDYIYYSIKDRHEEMRLLNYADYRGRYEEYDAAMRELLSTSQYFWRCDLDGSNPEMLIELPGASFSTYNIYDNFIYASYSFYDVDTHEQLGDASEQNLCCRINISTGEVTFLPRSDD